MGGIMVCQSINEDLELSLAENRTQLLESHQVDFNNGYVLPNESKPGYLMAYFCTVCENFWIISAVDPEGYLVSIQAADLRNGTGYTMERTGPRDRCHSISVTNLEGELSRSLNIPDELYQGIQDVYAGIVVN